MYISCPITRTMIIGCGLLYIDSDAKKKLVGTVMIAWVFKKKRPQIN